MSVTIVIENHTKFQLVDVKTQAEWGVIKPGPSRVDPGEMEIWEAHKTGWTATGSTGSIQLFLYTWPGYKVRVHWSAPYSFDFYSNTLSVAIMKKNDTLAQQYEPEECTYYNTVPECYQDDEEGKFKVTGIMGTNHNPMVTISVKALDEKDVFGKKL